METPLTAYTGSGRYVFVSYAHADRAEVEPELRRLTDQGINIWYDEGITPSVRWSEELAQAIEKCSAFLAFISPSFVASDACLNELDFALNRKRPILAVHLAETSLPAGVELSLGGKQAIHRHAMQAEVYESRIDSALRGLMGGEVLSRLPAGSRVDNKKKWSVALGLAVVAALLVLVVVWQAPAPVSAAQSAVGVLPFEVVNAGEDEQYLGEAIAEDLSMRLGSWRLMPVISHASMVRGDESVASRARYLVGGSAQVDPEELNVTAYLVETATDNEIWRERFAEPRTRTLAMQERLSQAIVARLRPALVAVESSRAARKDPSNVSAWEAAFRGWWHVNRDTREDLASAREWFGVAIERDPTWSWPHASIALTHYRDLVNGWSGSAEEAVTQMASAAEKAMALDASDAFSHHALGHAYQRAGRTDEALAAFARGVELAPFDAMANGCYGMQLAASNRPDEAIDAASHAMSLSPEDPWSHWFALAIARAHYAAGQYGDARAWADRSTQLKPTPGAMFHSIAATAMLGEVENARQRVETVRGGRPLPTLSMLRQGFSVTTEADYVARLMEGLRIAGFDE